MTRIELLFGHLAESRVLDDPRIVDQCVDPLPSEHHAFHHPGDARLVGDVDLETQGFAADVRGFGRASQPPRSY